MANRKMVHRGVVKSTIPAVMERDWDDQLGTWSDKEVEVEPAKEIELRLDPTATFGGFPIGRPIDVPKQSQKMLLARGYEFVSSDELGGLSDSEKKTEASREAERKRAFDTLKSTPGSVSGRGPGADSTPKEG